MESNQARDIDISTFHGGLLKASLDKSKGWGMYDLWSNKLTDGQKEWQLIAFDNVTKLLKDLDISFKAKKQKKSIEFKIPIPNAKDELKFVVHFKEEYMVVYAKWPYICSKSNFAEILEYINYVNSEVGAGYYYLDKGWHRRWANVWFKSMQLYSEVINYQVILCYWLIGMSMRVYEQYCNGLYRIMEGKQSAEQACEIATYSKYSNLCDWYDWTESPLIKYHFPESKEENTKK